MPELTEAQKAELKKRMMEKMAAAGAEPGKLTPEMKQKMMEKLAAAGADPGKLTPEMKKAMAKRMKSMNFKAAIWKLICYMKRYLPLIIFASLLSIAGTILNLLGPGRLSAITKLIIFNSSVSSNRMTTVPKITATRLPALKASITRFRWLSACSSSFSSSSKGADSVSPGSSRPSSYSGKER